MPIAGPEVLTLEAANALLPRVSAVVGRQLARRSDIEARLKALCELTGQSPDDLGPSDGDDSRVRSLKEQLAAKVADYQSGWEELEAMGGVVKDPRIGLVDFRGTVDGKRVWLCWKYGETEIGHYHGLDEGFSARKPIDPAKKRRLLN